MEINAKKQFNPVLRNHTADHSGEIRIRSMVTGVILQLGLVSVRQFFSLNETSPPRQCLISLGRSSR